MKYSNTYKMKLREGILLSFILLATFVLITPAPTHAYLTTRQEVVPLTSHTGLFLIEYSFGVKERTIVMPVMAKQGTSSSTKEVSFSIVDQDGKEVAGETHSIVVSNARITNDKMYSLPKGQKTKSTLAVVFTPKVLDPEKKYRLQVNYLPFMFDGTQQLQLNPSELQYYKTDLTAL